MNDATDLDQLDATIVALLSGRHSWDDDVPMPSSCWADGGPLLEAEEICLDKLYSPGGWDNRGGTWRAYWRGQNGELAEGIGGTMLEAGMRAIVAKHLMCENTPRARIYANLHEEHGGPTVDWAQCAAAIRALKP